jgi:hypothetical protein
MKYTAKTFTLPASSNWTSQIKWDRAFLPEADFLAKYGPQLEEPNLAVSRGRA